ncbi:MAG: transcription antitermination factor NusB [Alphaproteobacteria bacterium]|nr:transcription antitermination factor NusB [Alphaproteobacteria bacterium]
MSEGLPARRASLALLEAVLERGLTLEEAIAESTLMRDLEPRDRGFARLTVLTVLRHLGQLDSLIGGYMERPPVGRAQRALNILRIGIAHLLFLKTPAHAAVDAAVTLAKVERLDSMAGLINAVLRRATRDGADLLAVQDAERLNTPGWLWQDWIAQYGEETTRAIARGQLVEPATDLTVKSDIDHWVEVLNGRKLTSNSLRLPDSTDVTQLPGFAEGAWWVQDAAATLPTRLLGDVAGQHVMDLCAAPGGKTAQLIAAGAQVTAVDRSKPRLGRLSENLTRLGMSADVVTADAVQYRPSEPVAAILLDAPCSATGTLRRHPEIAQRRGPADIVKLAALQKRLITAAAEMLAPGGRVVIATCSLQQAEGPALYRHALSVAGLIADPIQPDELPEIPEAITEEGWMRSHPGLWQDQGGMDGFFAMRFRKAP